MIVCRGTRWLVLCLLLILCPLHAEAAIKVIPQPGTDPVILQKVQKAVNSFNELLYAEMKVTLTQDVTVFVCPSPVSYRDTLIRDMHFSAIEAERHAKLTSGISRGRRDAVALKFDPARPEIINAVAYKTTTHELFHQVQDQLSNDRNSQAMRWLMEGSANYVAYTIAEQVGYQSREKWKLDTLNTIRRTKSHAAPSQMIHISLEAWEGLLENKLYPYEMSDLMVLYLMSQVKGNPYEAIAEYFRLTAQGKNDEDNFYKAFGISLKQFLTGFDDWYAHEMAETAKVDITARGNVPADQLADFEKGVTLSRQYFLQHWATDLRSEVRFIVVPDKIGFADALVQEMGMDRTQAVERAKLGGWNTRGSITIVDLSYYRTGQGRTYGAAENMIARLIDEVGAAKAYTDLNWFAFGGRGAFAAFIVQKGGGQSPEMYERSLITTLKKADVVPSLTELSTRQGWEESRKRYPSSYAATANLAAIYLFKLKGIDAYYQWLTITAKNGNAEKALLEVYGLTTQDIDLVIRKLVAGAEAA